MFLYENYGLVPTGPGPVPVLHLPGIARTRLDQSIKCWDWTSIRPAVLEVPDQTLGSPAHSMAVSIFHAALLVEYLSDSPYFQWIFHRVYHFWETVS